jgi:AraC family transcriptional regulator of adaptative response/methylated-DNA-[protein]-cysteine methyltransferase
MRLLNVERAWQQVETHDAAGDGQFVYAVRTTGIYCRPSCPSRRPARNRVAFYKTPEEASAAGFRACKRCQPNQLHPQAARIAAACKYLDRAHETTPKLAEIGQAAGMSPFALQRLFRQVLGITPRQYFATRQTHRFREELARSATVTSAVYEAGYGSASRAYEGSGGTLGMTPATYRKGGAEETIRYTIAGSPLGRILVAATERGVCAIAFAETDAELQAGLERDFARATLERDDDALAENLAAVLDRLRESPVSRVLPLDVRATAFQRRVWEALREIPRGETRSYGEVAQSIGQPTAVRAVARACGQNPVAVVVPCHRVIGKDGAITGYRWGVERKRKLLALESESAHLVELEVVP